MLQPSFGPGQWSLRSCMHAGLLLAISGSGEEAPVLVVKAHPRAGELLHKLVEDQSDLARGYAARTLRMLAEDEEVREGP